jgi:hypothetical protein
MDPNQLMKPQHGGQPLSTMSPITISSWVAIFAP